MTTFQILTGENWNSVMYDAITYNGSWGYFASVYFLGLIIIGDYLVLNLFLAILIDGFCNQHAEEADSAAGAGEEGTSHAEEEDAERKAKQIREAFQQEMLEKQTKSDMLLHPAFRSDIKSLGMFAANSELRQLVGGIVFSDLFDNIIMITILLSCASLVVDTPNPKPTGATQVFIEVVDVSSTWIFIVEAILK